ncbi:transposase [Actinoplanes oblitus]|uniref:Transposase n=1 Tax=Actinoplanes oblitus TaxID=3040509 RepID=A0ABY8WPV4_9ACTN|nr:transposase [Actinoplanes oblitus]
MTVGGVLGAAPKKYPDELRRRAVRLYRESDPKPVIKRLAEQLGVHPEALRNWIKQDQADQGERDDVPTIAELEELRRLRRENDQLWGVNRRRKGADHTLSALKSIREKRPDGAPIYVILDNLSANKTPAIRAWAARNKVELCLTPTSASWANPIEAQFGPLRTFTMANSNHPNHTVLARTLQKYLRWRNANARHPDVLAAQRRERARVRSERQQRWGRPRTKAA